MSSIYGPRETEAWRLYELGKQYNNQLVPNQYHLVDTNIEFFVGNQWKGLHENSAMAALPKPVFNIIKRIVSLFVASLTSSSSTVVYEPLINRPMTDEMTDTGDYGEAMCAAQMATDEVANLFNKLNMNTRLRDALFDGAQTGDYCAHFYWDPRKTPYGGTYGAYRGEICMELVDGINVMFGNPNNCFVEDQPYIIIIGRDTIENLRAEYKQHHSGSDLTIDQIQPDADYSYQAGSGGKVELGENDKTGKALFLYYYTKKTKEEKLFNEDGSPKMEVKRDKAGRPVVMTTPEGIPVTDVYGNPVYEEVQATEYKTSVHVSKHTKFVTIFDEVDTGLTYYPIAWGNWERQKNQYHGRALVTGIIPNQIYINSMFALIMRHQQMLGFPKTLYDANVIGQWNNAVGQAIAVYDLPPDKRMNDLYGVIQPADMSTQIMRCIEMAMQYTKDCLGATDAQLGDVRPDNTSAIIALQASSQVPLENPQALKYEWIGDIGRILLDMMGTYYGTRPIVRNIKNQEQVIDPSTGQPTIMEKESRTVQLYDFGKLKHVWLDTKANVGASSYWSKIATVQTLDNLKMGNIIDVIDYVERMPDEYIPKKAELLAKLRQKVEQTPPVQPMPPGDMPPEGGPMPEEPGINPDVASAAIGKGSAGEGALIAAMPHQTQQLYNNLGTRAQKTLLRQANLTNPGM